jgi:hypothetical protein
MFEQTFRNIDNVLRTESDCQNELDYIEQTAAALSGRSYTPIPGAPMKAGDRLGSRKESR